METIQDYPNITLIVIGFNESSNLKQTFTAIKKMNYPSELLELIYVDSGSSDNSLEIARQYCDNVFIEPLWPTAARNRNRGLIESSHEICHFLDGDIIIDPDYLTHAVAKLQEGNVHAVFGKLVERNSTSLSEILLHDYSLRKPGYVDSTGAGGTFLKKALLKINGWDERIPRGEETELGERFRQAGFKIWYLDTKMGEHDFGISNLLEYFHKQVKEGESMAAVLKLKGSGPFFKNTYKNTLKNIIFNIFLIFAIVTSILIKSFWALFILFILYPFYLYIKYKVFRKINNKKSLKFYFLMNYSKPITFFGYIKYNTKFIFMPKTTK